MNQKPKDFYVYLHRRATNGNVFYVGKGYGKRAFNKSTRNPHWKNIVRKHGLIVEIYLDCLQEWYAHELEKDLIAYYGRENLCNFTDGGDGTSGFKFSEEEKKKMSKSRLGNKYALGMKHSEETRQIMKNKNKNKRTIYYSNGYVFKSAVIAAEWIKGNINNNATPTNVTACYKGRSKTYYGLKFSYEKKEFTIDTKHHLAKTVLCSNNMKFNSATDASIFLKSINKTKKCHVSAICVAAKKPNGYAYGFNWSYI